MESQTKSLKIFVHALDAAGHLNACIGFAQALRQRGHRIVFLAGSSSTGQLTKYGFEVITLKPNNSQDNEEISVKALAKLIHTSNFYLTDKSPLEKLQLAMENDQFSMKLYSTMVELNPLIEKEICEQNPDLFIFDHFLIPPCIFKVKVPWIYLHSANPLALFNSDKLPPFSLGCSVYDDPSKWNSAKKFFSEKFINRYRMYQQKLFEQFNYEPTTEEIETFKSYCPKSTYLNIYAYPKELDYHDVITIPDNMIRVDTFCRIDQKAQFQLPPNFVKPGQKLIYLSLGSMASVDVQLMKRITTILSLTPHKCIVSKGPRADEYDLPENCWGAEYLPQTQIVPLVDLVITHGGNNTTTETFSLGKPMIVMPLFMDQYDNAQRLHDKGFGVRLDPYQFEDEQLIDAIERLLSDAQLHTRLKQASQRIQSSNRKAVACEYVEALIFK